MGALTDPETASYRRDPQRALYYTGQAKWTSPVTSRVLLEAGYSTNVEYVTIHYQPGVARERGTADWYNAIGRRDLLLLTNYDGVPDPTYGIDPKKYVITGAASYVTGSHSLRAGVQWGFGDYVIDRDINGDLVQLYRNGVVDSVRVFNTPVRSHEYLNADLGMYAQDSWTMKKLTLNLGVRFDYFNGEISQQDVAAGRFVPRRQFDEVSRMPNWLDVAPRLGVAYDTLASPQACRTDPDKAAGWYVKTLGTTRSPSPAPGVRASRFWLGRAVPTGRFAATANKLFDNASTGWHIAGGALTGPSAASTAIFFFSGRIPCDITRGH